MSYLREPFGTCKIVQTGRNVHRRVLLTTSQVGLVFNETELALRDPRERQILPFFGHPHTTVRCLCHLQVTTPFVARSCVPPCRAFFPGVERITPQRWAQTYYGTQPGSYPNQEPVSTYFRGPIRRLRTSP
jgi:hypothetical protein